MYTGKAVLWPEWLFFTGQHWGEQDRDNRVWFVPTCKLPHMGPPQNSIGQYSVAAKDSFRNATPTLLGMPLLLGR
jgi:hypothetical protein